MADVKVALERAGRVMAGADGLAYVLVVVKPFRARAVLESLVAAGYTASSVREVMGYGRQKNRLHHYLGSEYSNSFVPKVEIGVIVERSRLAELQRVVVASGRTGRMGDGKMLVMPCIPPAVTW